MERRRVYSREELRFILEEQILNLSSSGCPLKIINGIEAELDNIIDVGFNKIYTNNNLPILLSVPFNVWGYNEQIRSLAKHIGKDVEYCKNKEIDFIFKQIKKESCFKNAFHVLFDIERGKRFLMKKRRILSIEEVIAYSFHCKERINFVSLNNELSGRKINFLVRVRKNSELSELEVSKCRYEEVEMKDVLISNGI